MISVVTCNSLLVIESENERSINASEPVQILIDMPVWLPLFLPGTRFPHLGYDTLLSSSS